MIVSKRMTATRGAFAALVVVTALSAAGCGSGAESAADAPVTSAPVTAPPAVPTTAPVVDAIATCRGYMGDAGPNSLIMRIPTVINSIKGSLSSDQVMEMLVINAQLEQLIATAPSNMAPYLRMTQIPFGQVATAASTGGPLTLNTGVIKDAAFPLIKACADAGYRANG